MAQDLRQIRVQLQRVISRAEIDERFRRRLIDDPAKVLEQHGLTDKAVDRASTAFDDIRAIMSGCNDLTCFSSGCPDSCYVTVCGTTDCGDTYPEGAFVRREEQVR